ncbi:prefoldin subunit 5 [Chlorella sorokiniana]|uniref:Prefoldin subunit 5 n=1 Tax=Chlorella sorokiniana TaxID=3076 RepID=A0A2P6TJQ1_CHLSO|nr:prefoldin subunit 5 [Chlorella sorokiniana]|eukprot:PRW44299.1 prefoldin subunit 5 [Chlorella sorokiniana]
MAGEPVSLNALGPQELVQVRQQLEQELQTMTQNAVALQGTAGKFAAAGQAVEYLQEQKQGQPVLLPLTESLYVGGALESVDSVLLEVGTGYFVERDIEGGVDYCRRKVLFVKDKLEQLSQLVKQRQAMLAQVDALLDQRMGEQQAAGQQAAAGPAAAGQKK